MEHEGLNLLHFLHARDSPHALQLCLNPEQ